MEFTKDQLELRKRVAKGYGVPEDRLIWGEHCNNPETCYHDEDGTIKCKQGYWVIRLD